ncbi:Abortive infection bacteriophage resistance protein [Streptococcus criceti]|uniref:Uncharacterized protein n=1 Tax=Streptococcus criceti HS-6 TaxID=873449 RepID=G5JQ35_STRCG|nr:Abi family protein [Streptococcus criceti]EHI74476.1 hypothetical protein STRCR_0482 [Streptococcus criceti HS-6]SUN41943.1 Abortive infection bacteriophage resistance protein [Streptococcus criceti]
MNNLYTGVIKSLSSYYGIIAFIEKRTINQDVIEIERNIPFFTEDFSQYNIGDKVSFWISSDVKENSSLLVRSQKVQFATNVNVTKHTIENTSKAEFNFYQFLNSKFNPSPDLTDELSLFKFLKTNALRYSAFNEVVVLAELIDNQITISEFKNLIDYDRKYKEFIMKWILFVEDDIKGRIENRFSELNITNSDLITKFDSNKDAKKLIKETLKKIRKKYLLRDAGDLRLHYEPVTDKVPKLQVAPLDMILDEFTVKELLDFIHFTMNEYADFCNDNTTDWEKVYDYLSELKLIRNISAHGNSFLSAAFDKKNNPNYLLEENAQIFGEDPFYIDRSKTYSIFNLVRSPIKLTSKGHISSPQQFAVLWTQKLLNNQTLRSFFYFYFMVCYLTDATCAKKEFKNELRELFGETPNKVNFERVVENVKNNPNLDEKDRENILTILIPQAINMFDYVKEHQYEYDGVVGDTVYEIAYNNQTVRINLSDKWYSDMIIDIAKKYPDEKETWKLPECQEIREKFGDFFKPYGARELLVKMLDSNLVIEIDEGIKQLLKIKDFNNLKILFLDILDIFS